MRNFIVLFLFSILSVTTSAQDCPEPSISSTLFTAVATINGELFDPATHRVEAYAMDDSQTISCGDFIPNGGFVYFQVSVNGTSVANPGEGLAENELYSFRIIAPGGEVFTIPESWPYSDTQGAPTPLVSFSDVFNFTSSALPVELAYFRADCDSKTLSWKSNVEEAFYGFELQSSQEGTTWALAGFYPAAGPSQYVHEVRSQQQLYRLKMIDMDGSIAWSEIIPFCPDVTVTPKVLSIFPNPAMAELTVLIEESPSPMPYQIIDSSGRTLRTGTVAPYQSNLEINVSSLPAGIYYVNTGGSTSTRFAKQ